MFVLSVGVSCKSQVRQHFWAVSNGVVLFSVFDFVTSLALYQICDILQHLTVLCRLGP